MYYHTTGDHNVDLGVYALKSITTGNDNVCIGMNAGNGITTGSENIFIGAGVADGGSFSTGSNNIIIGVDANPSLGDQTNELKLGNGSTSVFRCNVQTISSLSDARDKTDVIDIPDGLDFINSVRPVKYKWDRRIPDDTCGLVRAGFIAQELQEAQKGSEYLDLIYDADPEFLEAKQGNLLPVMVKAIQELSKQNEALASEVEQLKSQLNN